MSSTTGNLKAFPKVLQNGVGFVPDADEVMANFDAVNDKNYICTEATVPASPYIGQEIFVTDADLSIAKRVFTSDGWYAIPIAKIG
jgi:hypothetical protein